MGSDGSKRPTPIRSGFPAQGPSRPSSGPIVAPVAIVDRVTPALIGAGSAQPVCAQAYPTRIGTITG